MERRSVFPGLSSRALGVDFGSGFLRLSLPGGDIALAEPAILARDPETQEVVAWGQAAADLVGASQEPTGRLVRTGPLTRLPVRRGGLAERDDAAALLSRAFARVAPGSPAWPRRPIVASCSGGARDFEQQALISALRAAGAGRVTLVPAALAAVLGAGVTPKPGETNLVGSLGAGVSEFTVLWGERPVICQALPVGGEDLDGAIAGYLRRHHRLLIGPADAERLKRQAGAVEGAETHLAVAGWDLGTGQPTTRTVEAAALRQALAPLWREIGAALQEVLEAAPPALLSAVLGRGLLLVGGGARLRGVETALQAAAPLPVTVAEQPETCVARGLIPLLHNRTYRPARFTSPVRSTIRPALLLP